jgi:hypothetical protein
MAASTEPGPIDWTTANTTALVKIPTHKMLLRAAGPPRKPGTPVVVVECGHGSSSCEWTTVSRQVSEFARIYTYDRSGLDKSEHGPLARTAENIAKELKMLLEAAKVEPPYIIVGHSYGGVLVREFLELMLGEGEDNVVGAVFMECNTEFSYKDRPEQLMEMFEIFMGNQNMNAIWNMGERHQLTPEEWEYCEGQGGLETNQATAGQEEEYYISSCDKLAEKNQFERKVLGDWRVSVIKGDNEKELRMVYDEAVKQGKGTEEERKIMEEFLGSEDMELKMMERQLELSSQGRTVRARKSGHKVMVTEAEIMTEEIKWVLEAWKQKLGEKRGL